MKHDEIRLVRKTAGRRRGRLLGGLMLLAAGLAAQGAQAAEPAAASRAGSGSTLLRVLATRSHMHCPVPGRAARVASIDSPGEWDDVIEQQGEVAALGRKVRWNHERVLLYAVDMQGGQAVPVRLESPSPMIRLTGGVLYWPVRQRPIEGIDVRSARPCVMAIIDRAFWQRIRIVPTRPL